MQQVGSKKDWSRNGSLRIDLLSLSLTIQGMDSNIIMLVHSMEKNTLKETPKDIS